MISIQNIFRIQQETRKSFEFEYGLPPEHGKNPKTFKILSQERGIIAYIYDCIIHPLSSSNTNRFSTVQQNQI